MSDNGMMEKEEIFSKVLRAGRRTYFFDVRSTKAGDYYLTITEKGKETVRIKAFINPSSTAGSASITPIQ